MTTVPFFPLICFNEIMFLDTESIKEKSGALVPKGSMLDGVRAIFFVLLVLECTKMLRYNK